AEAPRHAAALARHARLGQDWDRVVRHAAEAARQALSRFANRAAVGFMEDALTALDRLPPEPARLRQAIDLRFQLRDPLFRLGRTERLRARLAEAAPLAERLEDWERLGQLRLFESHRAWLTGDYPAAEDAADRAAVQARQKGDAALALRARFQLALCRLGRGRLEECASLMAEVAAGAEDPAVIGRYGLDPPLVAVALNYRARALADLGDLAGARSAMEACRHQAARVDLPFTWVFAALAEGAVLLAEGEAGAAAERLSWALGQCDKAETDLMRVVVLTLLGAAARAAGCPSEAAGHLREAIGLAGGMRFLIHQPLRLALLAEALLDAGPGTEAPTLAVEALTLAEAQGDAMSHAAARRALARLAAAPARG
ncbi:MAG: hypothetical protein K2X11_03130, partial [Acetobacteraceae bacterium]|nr:hypothetical protein [Acetobacteraceae bacterium]